MNHLTGESARLEAKTGVGGGARSWRLVLTMNSGGASAGSSTVSAMSGTTADIDNSLIQSLMILLKVQYQDSVIFLRKD